MTSYFLFTPDLKLAFSGSYAECMAFGNQMTREKMYEHLKVARVRAAEDRAFIIFDITADSTVQARGIRGVSRVKLQKLSKNSPFPGSNCGAE